jgi:hypothetical protein
LIAVLLVIAAYDTMIADRIVVTSPPAHGAQRPSGDEVYEATRHSSRSCGALRASLASQGLGNHAPSSLATPLANPRPRTFRSWRLAEREERVEGPSAEDIPNRQRWASRRRGLLAERANHSGGVLSPKPEKKVVLRDRREGEVLQIARHDDGGGAGDRHRSSGVRRGVRGHRQRQSGRAPPKAESRA